MQEVNAVVLLGILVVYSQLCRRVGLRRCGPIRFVEGSCTDRQGTDSQQLNRLLGPQGRGKLHTGRWEQVKGMAPKKLRGNQMKPGDDEERLPQSLSLGAASNPGITGKKMALKTHGALGNKQSAPTVDDGSGTGTKNGWHHGEGRLFQICLKTLNP
ncbi:hypothetical protein NDU88_005898 [Pleurodeles waltl]|uniref:Secreted protein n=1 Tax=Pleurodeles waltl TaxID=8319 RepID=A0AAV7WWJ9_PLEWA|nr:hypothetical protein NDU88_005898 [Pleurodeles waltl]